MDNPPKYPCPALPEGWLRQVVQRRSGLSAGKCDVYYYSPSGEKFRSKFQLGLHLGNVLDISRFDYVTGEMCAEPIKEKSTDGSSSPAKKRGSTKTDTPKSKKKDKIVVKFGSSVHKIPVSALDVKSEDEVADIACNTSLNETSASEGQVSSPVASESKRGRKRKRGSEASPTQLQKAIKQELLDNELAKAQEEFSQTMAEPKQRINGHRKSGKGSVFNFPEVKVNLGEKLGHKELKDTIKTEPSPEQTRQSAARTRVTRPKERRNVFAINMDGHQSPTRRKSPEKAKTSSPSTKKNTKRQKSPPKKSPASPPKTQKRNSSRAAPKAVTNAQGTEAMDLELQQLRKKLDEINAFVTTVEKPNTKPDNYGVCQTQTPFTASSKQRGKQGTNKPDHEAVDKCLNVIEKLVDKDSSSTFGHFVASELRSLEQAPELQMKLKTLIEKSIIQVTSEFADTLDAPAQQEH